MDNKCQTFGSLALSATTRNLVVIEGGARRKPSTHASAPRRRPAHRGASGLLALFVASVLVVCFLAQSVVDATHASHVAQLLDDVPKEEVSVVTGDTMWQIAERHSIEGVSTAELVRWMRQANNVDTACLYPGQTLVVPQTS